MVTGRGCVEAGCGFLLFVIICAVMVSIVASLFS